MMRIISLALIMMVSACSGPAVQSPDQALRGHMPPPACRNNQPPVGYSGPVSPYSLPCADSVMTPIAPSGVFDYSRGMPPRAVSGPAAAGTKDP